MDEITLKLNNPITEEQWDDITDVDFDHTDRIWFHTKHGKDVEFVKQRKDEGLQMELKAYREIRDGIKEEPTIEPEPHWIPVTERLPEPSCKTLVTTKWDTEYSVEYGFYWEEVNKWGTITNNVIAWMPLPEPYKEGQNE